MRHVHLLIKPASGLCNLNCRYCFYHDIVEKREQASYGLMTEDTLAAVLEKALAAASHSCTIAFQGGEPTLAGLDFFRKAVELQRRLNVNRVQVYNSIQTNGLLLDSQWAAFFRENHFLVGLSLDGMKDTHDLYRLDAQGQGTFNRAARVLQLLESHGVAYNILTVVNRATAQHVEKIYRFYQRNRWGYLQFIPCLDPLGEEPGSQEYSLTPEAYGDFLCRLFDLWYRDAKVGRAPSIRQFENYVEMLLGLSAGGLRHGGRLWDAARGGGGRLGVPLRLLRAGRLPPGQPAGGQPGGGKPAAENAGLCGAVPGGGPGL